jgi:hypothetical protein
VIYSHYIRPWHLKWGATPVEVRATLPGDDLVPNPKLSATHAITIRASAEQVWPWLVQMGQGRAGFYSYDWLENLFGCNIHNADRILPQFQTLKLGDGVRLHPKMPRIPVAIVEPNRALVLHADTRVGRVLPGMRPGDYLNVLWGFYLQPIDGHSTRLIERFRSDYNPSVFNRLVNSGIMEPVSFVMERKMLLGIKERAEKQATGYREQGTGNRE